METQTNNAISDAVAEAISQQSFYRRYSNTINAVVASLAAMLTTLVGHWAATGEMETSIALLSAIVPIVTGVSIRLTTNGITDSTRAQLEKAVELRDAEIEREQQERDALAERLETLPVYTIDDEV